MIRLKKFGIVTIRVKIAVRKIGRILKKENKLVHLGWLRLYYWRVSLQYSIIPGSYWDRLASSKIYL